MGDIANFSNALLGTVNTVNDTYSKYMEEQAKYEASNISIRLQREANNKLLELQQSNRYDQWPEEMNTFYEERKKDMENKDSPYYCRNNQTAKYVNEIIEQSRNTYQYKVDQMTVEKQRDMDIAKYNESCSAIDEMYQGQMNIDMKDELAKGLWETGKITTQQYQQEKEKNYYTGTYKNYVSNFGNDFIDTAIKSGKNFNETWDMYTKNIQDPKKYGIDGLETITDTREIKDKAKKECEQKYNAALYTMQQKNYDYHEQNLTEGTRLVTLALEGQPVNLNNIYKIVNVGQLELNKMGGNQLATGQQKALAKEYEGLVNTLKAIEKAEKSGSGSKNNPSFATSVYVKAMPDNYFGMLKDGTFKNAYAMRDGLTQALQEAFVSQEWKETEGMTQEQKEEWYNKNYSNFAMNKILDSKVLDGILQNDYPEVYAKWNILKKDFEQDIKKNPNPEKRKYSENAVTVLGEAIYDLVASGGKETDKEEAMKQFNAKINAATLDGLNGLLKGKGLFESEQRYLARTANELKDNDVVFTNVYGKEKWIPGTEEKVNAIANKQKTYLQNALGLNIEEPVYRKVENDIEPIPEFRASDGNTYHIEASKDGKTVNIVDQNGVTHQPLSNADQSKLDKEKKAETRAQEKAVHAETLAKEEATKASVNKMITQDTRVSNAVKLAGKVSEEQWKASAGNITERQILLNDTVNKINRMAKNSSDKDFKDKVGITKEEWNNMSGVNERYQFLMK